MERKALEQYPYILAEICDLRQELGGMLPSGCLKGAAAGPYEQEKYLSQLEEEARRMEKFLKELPNLRTRRIVEMRVLKRMKWEEIADEITRIGGRDVSSDSVKKVYQRAFCRRGL